MEIPLSRFTACSRAPAIEVPIATLVHVLGEEQSSREWRYGGKKSCHNSLFPPIPAGSRPSDADTSTTEPRGDEAFTAKASIYSVVGASTCESHSQPSRLCTVAARRSGSVAPIVCSGAVRGLARKHG